MKYEIIKHSHAAGESNYHCLLTPKYRRKIFVNEKVRKLVKAYLEAKAEQLKVIIFSVEFGKDHMHFFVGNCKNYSISNLMKEFKGYISRMMRKNHRELFRAFLWGDFFWSGGYFYRSVGAVTADTVRHYIDNSQEKHWDVMDMRIYKDAKQKNLNEFK